jgi:hypothetical protein
MKELETDLWALQLPPEWFAEQDEETIVICDEDEASVVEITTIAADAGNSVESILASLKPADAFKTVLAELDAWYYEMTEDDMFWREWLCLCNGALLIISHGCDESNKGMDDAAVDEILSTLALAKEAGE